MKGLFMNNGPARVVRVATLGLLLFGFCKVEAASYKIDAAHSEVGFQVTHLMISKVKGRFGQFEGTFEFDEKKAELKAIDIKVEMASVNTDNKDRDEHLRKDDFFNASKYPTMTFKGDKVEFKDGKPVKVNGSLTLRGVTKPLALDIDYRGSAIDPWGNEKIGFSATGKINRKDFGVNWNKALDKGGVAVSEEVMITIEGEAQKVVKK